jgi:very-short-patch-repair endonuclease
MVAVTGRVSNAGMATKEMLLDELAQGQHGVFTRKQVLELGYTAHEVRTALDVGRWVARHPGAYHFGEVPLTWRGELRAACFAGGPAAVVSHRAAAALHGLPGGRDGVVELVCPRWRRARRPAMIVHETIRLDRRDVVVVDGLPVTSPALTLLHLGAVCGHDTVEMAYQAARRRGLVTWDDCDAALAHYARRGRDGVAVLRDVIHRQPTGARPTESEMETALLQLLRRFGFPEPVTQHDVRLPDGRLVARVDFAYPQARVAIEYQSELHHSTEDERIADNRRRNVLRGIDWEVLEARRDVRRDPAPFLAALRAALEDRLGRDWFYVLTQARRAAS